jgi:hypothetical protein
MKYHIFGNPINIILILLIAWNLLMAQEQPDRMCMVWDDRFPFPSQEDLAYPSQAIDIMVHRAGSDNFHFLHDAAIVEHKNTLYTAWYNCPRGEMQESSLIRGRRSRDGGLTWSDPQLHNFPFASSKIYAGTLSSGQYFVLANIVSSGYRDLLTLAVGRPGKKQFSKMWKIREDYCNKLGSGPEWSYPCAIEYAGKLYVVYTSEKHHCCLTIIPISSLQIDEVNSGDK